MSPNQPHSTHHPPVIRDNCIERLMALGQPPPSQGGLDGANSMRYHYLETVCGLSPSAVVCLCLSPSDTECTAWTCSSLNGQQTALISGGGANTCQRPICFWNSISKDVIRSLRIYSNTLRSQSIVLWFHIPFHFPRGHSCSTLFVAQRVIS